MTSQKIVYQEMARLFAWYKDTENKPAVAEYHEQAHDELEQIINDYLPSGSGFDNGIKFDFDKSRKDRLILYFSYHQMIEGGYAGWYDYIVYITPSLAEGFNLRITGRDPHYNKEYFYDVFSIELRQGVRE